MSELREEINKYHIIFLDVKMNNVNGIDIARQVRVFSSSIFIVFITAHVEYSRKGYEVEAIRYITKNDIEKPINECMNTILSKMKSETEKVIFPFIEGNIEVYVNEIVYVESNNHILKFHMVDSKCKVYYMYEKLDSIEEILQEYDFLRIRKSQLVNMNYIYRINSYMAELTTNKMLIIPKEKYRDVKNQFDFFKGRKR